MADSNQFSVVSAFGGWSVARKDLVFSALNRDSGLRRRRLHSVRMKCLKASMFEDRRMRDEFGCFNEMSTRMTGGEDSPSFLLLFATKKK
jgi:hypothetical protein